MNAITLDFTPSDRIAAEVARLRATFDSGKTRSLDWRRAQLQGIVRLIDEQEEAIIAAVQADLRKSRIEAYLAEIGLLRAEAKFALKNLKKWARPRKVRTPMMVQPGKSWLQPEPLGVILDIASWNFPWQQSLQPVIGMLAAGNCVMVKPSELSVNCAREIARLLPQYIDPDAISVVQGGPAETGAILEQKFDHIIYTGGGNVGRIVMTAAARHLTPVTLEMGGKCPVIVDQTADIDLTARRIVWAKAQNAGQICINADYLMVHASRKEALIAALKREFARQLGEDPQKSNDYARIINDRHFDRLAALLEQGRVVIGGRHDRDDLYIEPTVIEGATPDSDLMTGEIFGPILPVMTWQDEAEIYAHLTPRDKPLALYVFSKDRGFQKRMVEKTSAGMMAINEMLLFAVVPELPFGGVGASGMGSYSGTQGFCTFSHFKPVLRRGGFMDLAARYAPYDAKKERLMRMAQG